MQVIKTLKMKRYGYSDMITRAKRIRSETTKVEFEYINILRDEDEIAEIHLTKAFKPDESFSLTRVHNFYTFKNNKILSIESL